MHGRVVAAEDRRVLVQQHAQNFASYGVDESIPFDYLVLACGRFDPPCSVSI